MYVRCFREDCFVLTQHIQRSPEDILTSAVSGDLPLIMGGIAIMLAFCALVFYRPTSPDVSFCVSVTAVHVSYNVAIILSSHVQLLLLPVFLSWCLVYSLLLVSPLYST